MVVVSQRRVCHREQRLYRWTREFDNAVYRPNTLYRATGVVLSDLRGEGEAQLDLFGEALRAERIRQVYEAVDQLDAKYGKHTVFPGSSFAAMQGKQHIGDRGELPRRQQMLLKGEGKRRRLGIPMWGEVR